MKRGFVIHVHGIATLEEARVLESLGVDWIGVMVGKTAAGRILEGHQARAIAAALKHARLCVEPEEGVETLEASMALDMGAGAVQVPWGLDVPRTFRESLAQVGIPWALARVPADEDDDPAWVQSRLSEAGAPPPEWSQIEICPSLNDGWRVLGEPSEDELDILDLDKIASKFPLLFALPPDLQDFDEAARRLPHARGFSWSLADELGAVPGAHGLPFDQLRALLEGFNAVSRRE